MGRFIIIPWLATAFWMVVDGEARKARRAEELHLLDAVEAQYRYRSETELELLIRQAAVRLANSQSALRRRQAEREQAVLAREQRFSDETMKKEGQEAAKGLSFANIDELRSLKIAPPQLVQLVSRCCCTLISGDDIGDAEAILSARSSSSRTPRSVRERQEVASDRLSTPRQLDSARGRLYEKNAAAEAASSRPQSPRPMSPRPVSPRPMSPRSHSPRRPHSARGRPSSGDPAPDQRPLSARSGHSLQARACASPIRVSCHGGGLLGREQPISQHGAGCH